MTNREAIHILRLLKKYYIDYFDSNETIDMAIMELNDKNDKAESEDKISKIKSEYLVMDEYGYTDKELVDKVNMLVDKVNELNALIQHKSRE